MSTKHTPGPWEADSRGMIMAKHFDKEPRRLEEIATTPKAFCELRLCDPSIDPHTIGVWLAEWRDRCVANAALIAAAPDLLEALRNVMGWYDLGDTLQFMTDRGERSDYIRTVKQARAAIAKAERTTP